VEVIRPNQVWATDITYVPLERGWGYLVAILDWYSRAVLGWRVSNTMNVEFCVEALEEALRHYGRPEIFNSDQGAQFTSPDFTGILTREGIRISMDGKGRATDNIFIERLWRSLKYEDVYLHDYATLMEAHLGIGRWIRFYNDRRPHQALDNHTPMELYQGRYALEGSAA
jgi:putative transposase